MEKIINMAGFNIGDRVQVVRITASDDQHLLNKFGRIILIADDINCVLAMDDGNSATVKVDQLNKI